METTPRAPISSRSRQAVMDRRASRAATPPRVRGSKTGQAMGDAEPGDGTSQGDRLGRTPPALPPSSRAPAAPNVAPLPPSLSAPAAPLVAPLPPGILRPQTDPAPLPSHLPTLQADPAAEPSDDATAQSADTTPRTETPLRVRTPTMYTAHLDDEDEADEADENSALLGEGSVRRDLAHNTKILNMLIEDVKGLKAKDAELERIQDELAQIDDEVDDSCETLATLISLAFLAPTFTRSHKCISLFLTFIVWSMQALLTYKLYANAKINDGGQVMLDLGSGYMEMNHTMASEECDGCCDESIHSTECRLGMMDAFENAIFERKAGECAGCEFSEKDTDPLTIGNRRQSGDRWSSEMYDMNLPWSPEPNEGGISLCFSERGLANGWLNLFAGMMIIIITLIREIQEALGGIYVVKQLKYDVIVDGEKTGDKKLSIVGLLSYVWVCVIVLFHCIIGVYLLYASFRRMINAPNDIWAVVESSISAFLVVSIDDAVVYVVLLHPMTKKAIEPLGQKSADPSTDIDLAERREKRDALGREYPPYPNNPGPPRILMQNKALEGDDPKWFETDCVLWHPTEHIMTAGGYLILYNYMIEWLYLHFFFWFVGGRLSKFCTLACEDVKAKNLMFEQVSLIIGKVGPLSIVLFGLVLDIVSISKHVADRNRRIVRCIIFYISAFALAEMFSSPAWVFSDEDESETSRRFWETSSMLWTYRFACIFAIGFVIPMLSRKNWIKWFHKDIKSHKCTIHVGGLSDYMDEEKHDEYVSELAETFKTFGTILTTEVRIRDKYEDGQRKVSWGLVSFNNEVSAQRAVAESASLGKPDWVVRLVDTKMVNRSSGHMAGLAAKTHDEFHDLLPVTNYEQPVLSRKME